MNTVLLVNATIGFSENLFLVEFLQMVKIANYINITVIIITIL